MEIISFGLGVIVGLMIRHFQSHPLDLKTLKPPNSKAQFLDPVSFKEKFDKSTNIDELLNG